MTMRLITIGAAIVLLSATIACNQSPNYVTNNNIDIIPENSVDEAKAAPIVLDIVMKGVGIDIPQSDFTVMKNAGINILTTEWGMEEDIGKVRAFLDKADAAGLKVVLDGGFSYTAWGFSGDDWDSLPKGKRPVWQKERVQNWISAFKNHPAVFAYDICNEYGENLPSGAIMGNPEWPKTAITLAQLKQARDDVLQIDPHKPVAVRTYEWDFVEPPLGSWRPFEAGIADILMLNLYSNYVKDNRLQWPEIIGDCGAECVEEIKSVDPKVKIWVSISAFESLPTFQRPTSARLTRDIKYTLDIPDIDGIAFFEWGPSIGCERGKPWYLPEAGDDLWQVIKHSIADIR